jgi:hypothetical protein
MRHHLSGERRHRPSDHGMIHDPTLIEVTDELVNPIFALKRTHSLDAVIGIAKYPYLAIEGSFDMTIDRHRCG